MNAAEVSTAALLDTLSAFPLEFNLVCEAYEIENLHRDMRLVGLQFAISYERTLFNSVVETPERQTEFSLNLKSMAAGQRGYSRDLTHGRNLIQYEVLKGRRVSAYNTTVYINPEHSVLSGIEPSQGEST